MADDTSHPAPVSTARETAGGLPRQVIIRESMFGWLGKLLAVALGFAILVIFGLVGSYRSYFSSPDKPQEKYHSLAQHAAKKIAIISVDGAILATEDGFVKRQIERVAEDTDVIAVVLRIDSPGGTVTASDYLHHHLGELVDNRKLPLVVSMGSLCASGGYYLAMTVGDQPDSIFAEPTTWTGSIGVIIPHYDLSGLLGRWNIKNDSIASGPLKQMGSLTLPMSEEVRTILQQMVDESYAGFRQIVLGGRPKFKDDPQLLDAVATGQVFTAQQAVDRGLVDKIGFVEDAIERAAELANYSTDDVRCVKYEERQTFMSEVLGAQAAAASGLSLDLAVLLDQTAPRAYYLWSGLPALLSNTRAD